MVSFNFKNGLFWLIGIGLFLSTGTVLFNLGWIEPLFLNDPTYITYLIATVLCITTLSIGYKSFVIKIVIKESSYEWEWSSNTSSMDKEWFLSEAVVSLGMIGTIIGFIIMLAGISNDVDFRNITTDDIHTIIESMSVGMYVALNTTLVGLVSSVIMKLQLVFLNHYE